MKVHMHLTGKVNEKHLYKKYAEELVKKGHAYYAFDSPEEIEAMREKLRSEGKSNLLYGHHVRMKCAIHSHLPPEETEALLKARFPLCNSN